MLNALAADIRAGEYGEVHALVITRHGRIAYEAYFTGIDDSWGQPAAEGVMYGPDRLHDIRSMTKSVVSTLVGIAIDRGEIRSVDARLTELLPRHRRFLKGAKEALTLRQLLTMSSGLVLEDDFPFPGLRNRLEDPTGFVLAQELVAAPGASFAYSDVQPHVVGEILQAATGKPIEQYAREVLFEPLGITSFEWTHDAKGGPGAAWGLRLAPHDLAKLGMMFEQGGTWGGRRIVSEAWLAQAMTPQVSVPPEEGAPQWVLNSGYGFFWWTERFSAGGRSVRVATGSGFGGQRLFVVPQFGLSVVILARRFPPDDPKAKWYPEQILHRVLLAV